MLYHSCAEPRITLVSRIPPHSLARPDRFGVARGYAKQRGETLLSGRQNKLGSAIEIEGALYHPDITTARLSSPRKKENRRQSAAIDRYPAHLSH